MLALLVRYLPSKYFDPFQLKLHFSYICHNITRIEVQNYTFIKPINNLLLVFVQFMLSELHSNEVF